MKQEKPHKFDIGEGYGIWTDLDGTTHRSFPDVFYRAKPGDSAGKYKIGDLAIMNQPTTKKRFGMFVIANVESGDFGGTGLKYKLTVHPYHTPEDLAAKNAENAKEKEPKMKRPTYKMQRIKLADCKPHADAEAYSASTEDRAALGNSIEETGVLSPIAVVPDEGNGECCQCGNVANSKSNGQLGTGNIGNGNTGNNQKWFVIDGIGRMNALIAAGEAETDAQVFDLGDLSVAEFVVCKNAMMRKVTTGTRVMAYLKCHEREVLAAAKEENIRSRMGSKWRNGWKAAVSCETAASDKGWSAKEIAGRIGVSKNDVLAGIELLKEVSGETESVQQQGKYVQLDLFETMDSVMHGETPIRRWKAAASGKVSKVGGKAAADYVGIGARTMVSLVGLFENWQTVPMESRGPIVERFKLALEAAPEDFRAVLEARFGGSPGTARPTKGKRR